MIPPLVVDLAEGRALRPVFVESVDPHIPNC